MINERSRKKIFLLSFLLLSSANVSHCATPAILDLSQKHFLEPSRLEEAIRATLASRPENLVVDISNSIFANETAFQGLAQALLSKDADGKQASTEISLLARRNCISPESMDQLFQMLLNSAANATGENLNETSNISESKNESSQNSTAIKSGEMETNSSSSERHSSLNHIGVLDVGWNPLQPHSRGWKSFLKSLQKVLQTPEVCPKSIRLERCGLSPGACRAIGKGIIHRYANSNGAPVKPLSLHLCGNRDFGDSGSAAIAAAIRTVVTNKGDTAANGVVLDTLDLSACEIRDAGAEALALALESSRGMCIRHLDLSNNKISDVGAAAIGDALLSSGAKGNGMPCLESLDLSGNKDIKDEAAMTIAEAVGKGLISCIKLRSCHILADGAAAFGKSVANLAKSFKPQLTPPKLAIDLSGNPLGVLRTKTKKGGKYSASAIKSKASATTAAYMFLLQKGIKRGLKDYGVDVGASGESDDEEEARSGMGDEFIGEDLDPRKARCGIKAFSNAILEEEAKKGIAGSSSLKCKLGLRRCFMDHGAADALAAALVHSREDLGIHLSFDLDMNPVLEEEMIEAIQDDECDGYLREMSDRYLDALEAMKEARERAAEAARVAAARMQAEVDFESQWDPPAGFDDDDAWEEDDYDEWDSDADYEAEDEDYY